MCCSDSCLVSVYQSISMAFFYTHLTRVEFRRYFDVIDT